MKKVLKPMLLTLVVLAVLTGVGIYLLNRGGSVTDTFKEKITAEQSDQSDDRAYRFDTDDNATELKLSGDEKNVLNFDSKDVYEVATSTAARERLDRVLKKKSVSLESPLIAANPFGTNENSFYFNFDTKYSGMVRYTITVADETIPDHVRYVDSGKENNLSTSHEFVVSGLVPGMVNYIIIDVLDSSGNQRDRVTYKYNVPSSTAATKLSVEGGTSKESCENGMFFLFPSKGSGISVYDNSGILRDVITTESGKGCRIYQSGDCVVYSVSDTKVAKVSSLGMVLGAVKVKGYGKIRDFSYDGYDNIYCLVTKKGRDYLVSASFQTGKTKKVYAFPKGVSAGSLSTPIGGSVYVACSKPDGIMKLEALTGNKPQVSYILGKKSNWKKIIKKNKKLKKKVAEDDTAVHWGTSKTILNLVEDSSDGTKDVLTAYLTEKGKGTGMRFTIDGSEKKITVNQSFPTGETGKNLALTYGNHFLTANLGKGTFTEYDAEGKTVKEYAFGSSVSGMTKLSLNDMCFYGGK